MHENVVLDCVIPSSQQCFGTVVRVAGSTSSLLSPQVLFENKWRKKIKGQLDDVFVFLSS